MREGLSRRSSEVVSEGSELSPASRSGPPAAAAAETPATASAKPRPLARKTVGELPVAQIFELMAAAVPYRFMPA
jgi:hypothetical protein